LILMHILFSHNSTHDITIGITIQKGAMMVTVM